MSMDKLALALIIVLAVDGMLFLGQLAILDINPSATTFYNYEGSFLQDFDAGNHTLNQSNPSSRLPTTEGSVNPETGNIFTDAISSIKSWFLDLTGIGYLFKILGGPVNFLAMLNLPAGFVFMIGVLWYGLTLFLVVAFIIGRT